MKGKKETVYSMGFSLLSKGVTYFLLLVLANFFLVEAYGKATFALNIFYLSSILTLASGSEILIPWIMKKKDVRSVFYFMLILGIIINIIGVIVTWNHKWAMPLAFLVPMLVFGNIARSFLQAKYKYHLANLLGLVYVIITLIVVILLRNYGALGIILGYSIAYFTITLLYINLVKSDIKNLLRKVQIKKSSIKAYLKKAMITATVALSFSFLAWIDSTILGWLSTFENVAIYNIASPIANAISLIPTSIGFFLLSRTSDSLSNRTKKVFFFKTIRICFTFSLLGAIVITSSSFLIIKYLFQQYIGSEPFIAILILGMIFYSIYHLIYTYTLGYLHPEKAFTPIIFAAIVNVVLDIILIPHFGLYGICFATLIAHFIAFTWLAIRIKILRRFMGIYLLILFIPLAYFLQIYGLILVPIALALAFFFRVIKMEDLFTIYNTIKDIIKHPQKI
tara:strand:- start:1119 stop:2471 length:1353 start_codon:yes stop_codon:yes gene_type:complete